MKSCPLIRIEAKVTRQVVWIGELQSGQPANWIFLRFSHGGPRGSTWERKHQGYTKQVLSAHRDAEEGAGRVEQSPCRGRS